MWKCPKCHREFKSNGQSHYCGHNPKSIDEYIAAQLEEVQSLLKSVRDTLRAVLPDAEERITWRMPTYWKKHNIIHFAAFKNHLGLYPGDQAIKHFADELAEYKTSKGAIQLPYSEPIPLDLITKIAMWCKENNIEGVN